MFGSIGGASTVVEYPQRKFLQGLVVFSIPFAAYLCFSFVLALIKRLRQHF